MGIPIEHEHTRDKVLATDIALQHLNEIGIESRPIVAGNFITKEVIKFFDYEVHGKLTNAEYIDRNGLFIGNHHYEIPSFKEAIESIDNLF